MVNKDFHMKICAFNKLKCSSLLFNYSCSRLCAVRGEAGALADGQSLDEVL